MRHNFCSGFPLQVHFEIWLSHDEGVADLPAHRPTTTHFRLMRFPLSLLISTATASSTPTRHGAASLALTGQPTPRRRVAKNFPTPAPPVLPPHAPHLPHPPRAVDRTTRRRREPRRPSRPESQVGRPVTGDTRAPGCAPSASRAVDYDVCIGFMCVSWGGAWGTGLAEGRPALCGETALRGAPPPALTGRSCHCDPVSRLYFHPRTRRKSFACLALRVTGNQSWEGGGRPIFVPGCVLPAGETTLADVAHGRASPCLVSRPPLSSSASPPALFSSRHIRPVRLFPPQLSWSTGAARGCPRVGSCCGQGHARPACGVAVLFIASWPGVQGQRGRATTGAVPLPVAGEPKPPLTAAAAHRTLPLFSPLHLPHCVRGDRWPAGVCLRPGPPSPPCPTRSAQTDQQDGVPSNAAALPPWSIGGGAVAVPSAPSVRPQCQRRRRAWGA